MKKRIVSLFLALVMALSLIPTTVWAEVAEGSEGSLGSVHVIVENTTYKVTTDADLLNGTLVDTDVALTADATMMSCVASALSAAGYTAVGADKGYISAITKGEASLGEFDGSQGSGWMGTLNDWFTNYGFGAFSVAEGDLSDGDVIRVMYTNNTTNDNAGGDLGGTWGNKNTTLSDLTVSGGQLLTEFTPGQSGGTYEYTLAIDSAEANIQVTPTAANKNYQIGRAHV